MEMWCPDDMGGIAGIGLGHPLGEGMIQLARVWVEAPRLVKRSLTRFVFLSSSLLLFLDTGWERQCVCPPPPWNAKSVTETNWWQVTWPSDPATPSPR